LSCKVDLAFVGCGGWVAVRGILVGGEAVGTGEQELERMIDTRRKIRKRETDIENSVSSTR
jgi:hypothetical protein